MCFPDASTSGGQEERKEGEKRSKEEEGEEDKEDKEEAEMSSAAPWLQEHSSCDLGRHQGRAAQLLWRCIPKASRPTPGLHWR